MIVRDFKTIFFEALSDTYPKEEIGSFFDLLIAHQLKMGRVDLALQPGIRFDDQALAFFKQALCRLQKEEPIQYIIGTTEFYGLVFAVNPQVLIPRPETEALVDWIIHSSWKKSPTILDIGTGSGCIAVSLAKNIPQANVYALDISAGALKTAANNASTNQVKVHFLERDLLSCNDLPKRFDIIVSNPPYVRELEKKQMQQNVLAYEPASALYVPDKNPLLFYRKISELATKHLDKEGSLFLEINQYLGKETCELLTSVGFANIELKKDLYKADRMVKAQFK